MSPSHPTSPVNGAKRSAARLAARIFLAALLTASAELHAEPPPGEAALFHACLREKVVNGVVVSSQLLLTLLPEDTPTGGFQKIQTRGQAEMTGDPAETLRKARHAALNRLLLDHGLKSVRGRRQWSEGSQGDEIEVQYEGLLRYPFHILQQGPAERPSFVRLEMVVDFSSLSPPQRRFGDSWRRWLGQSLRTLAGFFR